MFTTKMNSLFHPNVRGRVILRRPIIGVVLSLTAAWNSLAEISITHHPFPGIAIHSETRTNPPTRLFVAEIDLSDPGIQLRVAPGGGDPDGDGKWETTLMRPTAIAAREKFDLVVNGDFYEVTRSKDSLVTNIAYRVAGWAAVNGPAVSSGRIWSTNANPRPCLVVGKEGRVTIRSVKQLKRDDWEVVSGNVMLVRNGKVVAHDNKVRHPRTVVGLNAEATKLVIMVVDGRKPGVAVGMSYAELATEMVRLGCKQAINLDGGGSSVMAVRDAAKNDFKILNEPTDGRERAVANVLGISVGASVAK